MTAKYNPTAISAWLVSGGVMAAIVIELVRGFVAGTANGSDLHSVAAIFWALGPIVSLAVGALIVSKQSRNIIGWLLMLPGALWVVARFASTIIDPITVPPVEPSPLLLFAVWFSNTGWTFFILPLLFIVLLFPNGRPLSPRWRWVVAYGIALMIFFNGLAISAQELGPLTSADSPPWVVKNPFGFLSAAAIQAIIFPWWVAALGTFVLLATLSLFLRARRAGAVERTQIQWLLFACAVFVIFYVPGLFVQGGAGDLAVIIDLLLSILVMCFPLAIGIAVLRYRLFDLDLVVNRALVYLALSIGVAGVYVVVVGYLGTLFRSEGNLAFSLVATGIVAVLFAPVRDQVQHGVNRLMYGERDEPYRLLMRLGKQLETALEPSAALTRTVETVARALKLPYAAIALCKDSGMQIIAAYGTAPGAVNRFPLLHAGEPIGELMAAPRTARETLTAPDERLLRDLAQHIGVTAHAVRLTTELEQARLRIVTERGEARRRLGIDLHDGVGHQLVGLTRQVERAMTAPPNTGAGPDGFLADMHEQLLGLAAQVRSMAHQLFPPELEVLGLAGALRERALNDTSLRIAFDAPATLPRLPAEIETAVYYIALEALTNAGKHAQARLCQVRLRWAPGDASLPAHALELEVVDDGRGIDAAAVSGLGLLSMRARAAEIGGSCEIRPQPGGGTAVLARIPYTLAGG